jgi:hypothetical protein
MPKCRLPFDSELLLIREFVNDIIKPNLDYLAVIDLCYCNFTNAVSDAERVKQMAAKQTKPNPIRIK